jgi:hypothetical protein
MAKVIIHAYTQNKNNKHEETYQELLKTISNSLSGYVSWIDVVDTTNETTFKYEDRLEEEE